MSMAFLFIYFSFFFFFFAIADLKFLAGVTLHRDKHAADKDASAAFLSRTKMPSSDKHASKAHLHPFTACITEKHT